MEVILLNDIIAFFPGLRSLLQVFPRKKTAKAHSPVSNNKKKGFFSLMAVDPQKFYLRDDRSFAAGTRR